MRGDETLLLYAGMFFAYGLGCGFIAQAVAREKGISQGLAFVLGFFLGIIGIIVAAVLPQKREQAERVAAAPPVSEAVPVRATKRCPQCAEDVKAEAKVCRFCGHHFAEA